jgi:hypothetical protein
VTVDDRNGTTYRYGYQQRGRLRTVRTGAAPGTLVGNYFYDGFERLAYRNITNTTHDERIHYVFDLNGRLLAEARETGRRALVPSGVRFERINKGNNK